VILLLCALIQTFTATRYVSIDEITERMEKGGASEEQMEKAKRFFSSPLYFVITFALLIVSTLIFLLLVSVIINFALPLFGADGTFLMTFALIVNTGLISGLGNIIRTFLILIKKRPFVLTSPALILPPAWQETFLFRFLSQFDFFTIWRLFLIGLGLTVVYDLRGKKGFYLIFGLYLIWIIFATTLFHRAGVR